MPEHAEQAGFQDIGVPGPQIWQKPLQLSVEGLAAASASLTAWIADGSYQVLSAQAVFSAAGGAAALADVTVETGTQAPGAGTAQTTAGMALTGAANTVLAATLSATPTAIAAGNRVSVKLSGTLTVFAGLCVNIVLKRVG